MIYKKYTFYNRKEVYEMITIIATILLAGAGILICGETLAKMIDELINTIKG